MIPMTALNPAPAAATRLCYGMATATAVREFIAAQGDTGSFDVPHLRALLNLLEADGHQVGEIRKELDRVASIVYSCRDALYTAPRVLGRGAGRP
jgi:hypothetical protein